MSLQDASVSIWDAERIWVTVGAVALMFLAATEALAVTTVMPVVSASLDGQSLYAVAFTGTLATSVVGMVAAGAWADARGPRGALYLAVLLFIAGLLISGFASTMAEFLVGRLVQGLGVGGQTVALYVVVARLYPSALHGRVFAVFAAAWIIPSMISPFLAGAVAEFIDWRWTFLGVAALLAVAFSLVVVRVNRVDLGGGKAPDTRTIVVRLFLAAVVAALAVTVGLTADAAPSVGWPVSLGAVLLIGFAVLPLVPRRTLRAGVGLPSVILMRGLAAGAFFAAEAYVPYLLMERFAFSPTWAGVALVLTAFTWAGASELQGRLGERLGNRRIALLSLTLLASALLSILSATQFGISPIIVVIGWSIAGAGMGLLYPRLTVLTLAYSDEGNQGFNTSALSIFDAAGSAVAIAFAGLAVATLGGGATAFGIVFVICGVFVVLAAIPGLRLGSTAEAPR